MDEYVNNNAVNNAQLISESEKLFGDEFNGAPRVIDESTSMSNILDILSGLRDYNNAWSSLEAARQRDWSSYEADQTRLFNMVEAAKSRNWQEYMSNTSHVRETKDLIAAGLNPVLSAMGGNGASVGSGATASASNPSGSSANGDQSTGMAMANIFATLLKNQNELDLQRNNAELVKWQAEYQGEINKFLGELNAATSYKNALAAASASMYGANKSAAASEYAALKNYESNKYKTDVSHDEFLKQLEWNSEHPNNPYQLAGELLNNPEAVLGAVNTAFDSVTGLNEEDHKMHYDTQYLLGTEYEHRYWYDQAGAKHEEWRAPNGKWYGHNPITG